MKKRLCFAPRQGRQPPASPYNVIHHAAATNGWLQISLNAGINVDLPLHLMGCSVLSLSWHSVDAPLDDISEIDPVHGHVITDAHQAGEAMAERLPHQDWPHACAGKNARGLSSLFLTLVPSLSWQAIGFHSGNGRKLGVRRTEPALCFRHQIKHSDRDVSAHSFALKKHCSSAAQYQRALLGFAWLGLRDLPE
eukprot:COSAG06_NODE_3180_length_5723_cov_3.051209_1_plen_194_part_00